MPQFPSIPTYVPRAPARGAQPRVLRAIGRSPQMWDSTRALVLAQLEEDPFSTIMAQIPGAQSYLLGEHQMWVCKDGSVFFSRGERALPFALRLDRVARAGQELHPDYKQAVFDQAQGWLKRIAGRSQGWGPDNLLPFYTSDEDERDQDDRDRLAQAIPTWMDVWAKINGLDAPPHTLRLGIPAPNGSWIVKPSVRITFDPSVPAPLRQACVAKAQEMLAECAQHISPQALAAWLWVVSPDRSQGPQVFTTHRVLTLDRGPRDMTHHARLARAAQARQLAPRAFAFA